MLVTMWLLLVHGKQECLGVGPVCDMDLPRFQQEDAEVCRFCADTIRGIPHVPPVRLHSTAEVTPTGAGICTEGHTRNREHLWTGIDVPQGRVPTGPLQGRIIGNPGAGVHPPDSETGGTGPPRPNKEGPPSTLLQRSGARRSSGWRITPPTGDMKDKR